MDGGVDGGVNGGVDGGVDGGDAREGVRCEAYLYAMSSLRPSAIDGLVPLFLIVGSDGLWDVMSNLEATELVCELLTTYIHNHTQHAVDARDTPPSTKRLLPAEAMHGAAKMLAHEAFIRGSRDNIGVCVVELYNHRH